MVKRALSDMVRAEIMWPSGVPDQARRVQIYSYFPGVPFGFDIPKLLILEQNSSNNPTEIGQISLNLQYLSLSPV